MNDVNDGADEMAALIFGSSGAAVGAAPGDSPVAGPLPAPAELPPADPLPPGQVEVSVAYLASLQAQVADGREAVAEAALAGGNPQIEAALAAAVADGRLAQRSLPGWRRMFVDDPAGAGNALASLAPVLQFAAPGRSSSLSGSAAGVVDIGGSRRLPSPVFPDGTIDTGGKWSPSQAALSGSVVRHPATATEEDWDGYTADLMGLPPGRRAQLAARRAWGPDQWFSYSIGIDPDRGGRL